MAKAPDRGSFPLDHFHQCDQQAKSYSNCIVKHQLMPKRCRQFQMQYLQCRMKSGLMEEQQMHKLGFLQTNSWQTQQAQRKNVLSHIEQLKKDAWQNAKKNVQTKKNQNTKPANLPE